MWTLKGIAAHTGARNRNGVLFNENAFDSALQRFSRGEMPIRMLDSHGLHKTEYAIGRVTDLSLMGNELSFSAQVMDLERTHRLTKQIEVGVVDGVSITWQSSDWKHSELDNGRRGIDVNSAAIEEISLVLFPADPFARVTNLATM